jgi:hypothetical protein
MTVLAGTDDREKFSRNVVANDPTSFAESWTWTTVDPSTRCSWFTGTPASLAIWKRSITMAFKLTARGTTPAPGAFHLTARPVPLKVPSSAVH